MHYIGVDNSNIRVKDVKASHSTFRMLHVARPIGTSVIIIETCLVFVNNLTLTEILIVDKMILMQRHDFIICGLENTNTTGK